MSGIAERVEEGKKEEISFQEGGREREEERRGKDMKRGIRE